MFPSTRNDVFECALTGAVTHPVLLCSGMIVAVVTPLALRPLEDDLFTASDHSVHIARLLAAALLGLCGMLLLIRDRRRGPDSSSSLFAFLWHRGIEPPPTLQRRDPTRSRWRQHVFVAWQLGFAVCLALTLLVFDFVAFPSHARRLELHSYEGIGHIVQHPVLSMWSWLRPLSMLAAALFWTTWLGWLQDARQRMRTVADLPQDLHLN